MNLTYFPRLDDLAISDVHLRPKSIAIMLQVGASVSPGHISCSIYFRFWSISNTRSK